MPQTLAVCKPHWRLGCPKGGRRHRGWTTCSQNKSGHLQLTRSSHAVLSEPHHLCIQSVTTLKGKRSSQRSEVNLCKKFHHNNTYQYINTQTYLHISHQLHWMVNLKTHFRWVEKQKGTSSSPRACPLFPGKSTLALC